MSSRIAVCGQQPVSTATIRSSGSTAAARNAWASSDVKMSFVTTTIDSSSRSRRHERTDQRRLAAADRTADADAQGPVNRLDPFGDRPAKQLLVHGAVRDVVRWHRPSPSVHSRGTSGDEHPGVEPAVTLAEDLGERPAVRRQVTRLHRRPRRPLGGAPPARCARHVPGHRRGRPGRARATELRRSSRRRRDGGTRSPPHRSASLLLRATAAPERDRLVRATRRRRQSVESRAGPDAAGHAHQLAAESPARLAKIGRQCPRGVLRVEHRCTGRNICDAGRSSTQRTRRRPGPWSPVGPEDTARASPSSATSPTATAASTPAE